MSDGFCHYKDGCVDWNYCQYTVPLCAHAPDRSELPDRNERSDEAVNVDDVSCTCSDGHWCWSCNSPKHMSAAYSDLS